MKHTIYILTTLHCTIIPCCFDIKENITIEIPEQRDMIEESKKQPLTLEITKKTQPIKNKIFNQHAILDKEQYLDMMNKEIHKLIHKIIAIEKSITVWKVIVSTEAIILGLLIYTFNVLEI